MWMNCSTRRQYQHTGVAARFYQMHFDAAERTPQTGGEMGWILETNKPMNRAMEGMGGRIVRRYRVYERELYGCRPRLYTWRACPTPPGIPSTAYDEIGREPADVGADRPADPRRRGGGRGARRSPGPGRGRRGGAGLSPGCCPARPWCVPLPACPAGRRGGRHRVRGRRGGGGPGPSTAPAPLYERRAGQGSRRAPLDGYRRRGGGDRGNALAAGGRSPARRARLT